MLAVMLDPISDCSQKVRFVIFFSLSLHITNQGGKHSFCQLMTASMPTFIGRNITGIRPTHDCFCANLGHIMTAFMPTLGLTA